jgi:hypothetical protein
VLVGERDRLAVDVLDGRDGIGNRVRAGAHRDGDRHRRQHVGGVVFLVDGLVADDRPAGGAHHLDVEAVLGIEAQRMRHDDRRRAGDRDEADLEVLLLDGTRLGEGLGGGADGEEGGDGGGGRRGANRPQEGAALVVLREEGAHHRLLDDAAVAALLAGRLDSDGLGRDRRLVLGIGGVAAADAALEEPLGGIERIVEQGHGIILRRCGGRRPHVGGLQGRGQLRHGRPKPRPCWSSASGEHATKTRD